MSACVCTVHTYVCLCVYMPVCAYVYVWTLCISVHVWNAAGQGSPSTGMRWGNSLLTCCG